MTKGTKKIGTSNLKSLIEGDKLLITDFDIISELSTFISKGKSFEAESGATDDLSDVFSDIFVVGKSTIF